MVAIEVLQERIEELEKQIYGTSGRAIDDSQPETAIVDSLIHVNTLVSSTLSGREKTNALVKKLFQLNDLLDTFYDEDDLHTAAKLEVVLAMERELRDNLNLLNNLEELMPALATDNIKNVPEMVPKLEQLTVNYLKAYEESNDVNLAIRELFSKYNNIIEIISKSLINLDSAITTAELAAAPKKQLD